MDVLFTNDLDSSYSALDIFKVATHGGKVWLMLVSFFVMTSIDLL